MAWDYAKPKMAIPDEVRERLLQNYHAGATGLNRFRRRISFDENGLERQDDPLPDYLCSGDMIAALGCLRDILDAAFPQDESDPNKKGR